MFFLPRPCANYKVAQMAWQEKNFSLILEALDDANLSCLVPSYHIWMKLGSNPGSLAPQATTPSTTPRAWGLIRAVMSSKLTTISSLFMRTSHSILLSVKYEKTDWRKITLALANVSYWAD